jgi:hypothetical protein
MERTLSVPRRPRQSPSRSHFKPRRSVGQNPLFAGWRRLTPAELVDRILLIQRAAADPANPHRLTVFDWKTLDEMRRAASFNRKHGV